MADWDVIVAGVGAMGAATLQHLAARRVRVLGIDRFGIGHEHGSSGGDTRLIRKAYFEHPDYVPLLHRAWDNWQVLEAATGRALLHATGILYIGPADSALIAGSRRAAADHGLRLEDLAPAELAARFPQFRVPPGHVAVFEPEAGFVLSTASIRAQVDLAVRAGAGLVLGERLLGWEVSGDGVEVRTDRARYRAARLVITAGSGTGPLLAGLGLQLTVTRQTLFWTRPAGPAAGRDSHSLGHMPAWAVQREDEPGLCYGFPALDAPGIRAGLRPGVKLARHLPGQPVVPGQTLRPADGGEYQALQRTVREFLPALSGPCTGAAVCKYTMSADEHFIVDRHPRHRQVVFGCGFSGHGFKFASVMGEALADLALEGRTGLPVGFLRAARLL